MTALNLSPQIIRGRNVLVLTGSATYDHRHKLPTLGGAFNASTDPKQWEMPDTQEVRDYYAFMLQVEANAAPKRGRGRPRKYHPDGTPIEGATLQPDEPATPGVTYAQPEPMRDPQADEAKARQLRDLIRDLSGGPGEIDESQVREIIDGYMAGVRDKFDGVEAALALIMEKLATARTNVLTVHQGNVTRTIKGLQHVCLPDLIKCLAAGVHVWIAGPSQAGKTTAAEMAAEALGLTFRLQGSMTMAHELIGFVDAAGRYHETAFVASFRNGGVILLDELDRGSNEALLAINSALANGVMCLPSGEIIRAHADFKCVGAANTWGHGATHDYVGAARIDGAFLQRFGAAIDWQYDTALEVAMSGNEAWAHRVQAARAKAKAGGLKVLITPKNTVSGALLIAAGYTPDQAARMTYLRGLSADDIRKLEG